MLALTYFHETWQMIWPFICNLGFIKQVYFTVNLQFQGTTNFFIYLLSFLMSLYLYLILFPNLKNFVHAFLNLIYLLCFKDT